MSLRSIFSKNQFTREEDEGEKPADRLELEGRVLFNGFLELFCSKK